MSHKVAEYVVRPMSFDADLVKMVATHRKKGKSLTAVARDLKVGTGKVAMAELLRTTERVSIENPEQLAKEIVKDRKSGDSWGLLSARYGVTEGTVRAAYEAAAGEPFTALDFRRKAEAG